MRITHSEVVALAKFRAQAPTLATWHCFGEGNPCAHLASCERLDELGCCVLLNEAAPDFITHVRQRCLSALEPGRTR